MPRTNETLKRLLILIEQKRKKMIDNAMSYGMDNIMTLKYSQELDKLILEYETTLLAINTKKRNRVALTH